MTEDIEDGSPRQMNKSIDKLQTQKENLIKARGLCLALEGVADVTVQDNNDSHIIQVIIEAGHPHEEMTELADMDNSLMGGAYSRSNIIYNHGDDTYKLEKKFRTDR